MLTLDEAARRAAAARAAGKRIVLAHGVFDLLHVGHIRHLRAARALGDLLFVSITADEHVHKGPNRPAFGFGLRAEMLTAIAFVDAVIVVHDASAVPVIEAVKPDIYVKGHEYADPADDVTGAIVHERKAIERHGGSITFTNEMTFSSSKLLNTHFDVFEPEVRNYLQEFKRDGNIEDRIAGMIEDARNLKILFVGDAIIDEYEYVVPMGKSAKEHMIATIHEAREAFAGGVFAAANDVADFCARIEVATCFGDAAAGENYEAFVRDRLRPNVSLQAIYRAAAPTTRKTRFIDPTYLRKLFEVYHMDDRPLAVAVQADFDARLAACAKDCDAVFIADFGHGLLAASTVEVLTRSARFLAVNVQTNSANLGYNLVTKYGRADYVCIDAMEARLATRHKHADIEDVCGRHLPELIDSPNIIVTQGKSGCFTYNRAKGRVGHIPAFTGKAVDTVGAGDAFFAVTAAMVAAGGDIEHAGFVGNVVGGIKAGIVGHRKGIEKGVVRKHIATLLK